MPVSDARCLLAAGFPVWFLHGRHDLVAMPEFAEQLAAKFAAPCVYVDGAHFIPRENAVEVSLATLVIFDAVLCCASSPCIFMHIGMNWLFDCESTYIANRAVCCAHQIH